MEDRKTFFFIDTILSVFLKYVFFLLQGLKLLRMDSLVTLLNKKRYDLVLDLTKNATDAESIFCRVSALLALQKSEEAMDILIEKRQILWDFSPIKTMKATLELRFILNQFDEAYDDAAYFSSLPYVSQEVEEYLHSLGKMIRYNERQSSMKFTYSEEEVRHILETSNDKYEIISLLSSFNDAKATYFSSSLKELLIRNESSIVKTYALMLLSRIKYAEKISFNKNGQSYDLSPKDLTLPTQDAKIILLCEDIQKEVKDPSLFNIAKNILNNYTFELFPSSIFEYFDEKTYLVSFVNLAHKYLQQNYDCSQLIEKHSLDEKLVISCQEKIEKTLAQIEKIKV